MTEGIAPPPPDAAKPNPGDAAADDAKTDAVANPDGVIDKPNNLVSNTNEAFRAINPASVLGGLFDVDPVDSRGAGESGENPTDGSEPKADGIKNDITDANPNTETAKDVTEDSHTEASKPIDQQHDQSDAGKKPDTTESKKDRTTSDKVDNADSADADPKNEPKPKDTATDKPAAVTNPVRTESGQKGPEPNLIDDSVAKTPEGSSSDEATDGTDLAATKSQKAIDTYRAGLSPDRQAKFDQLSAERQAALALDAISKQKAENAAKDAEEKPKPTKPTKPDPKTKTMPAGPKGTDSKQDAPKNRLSEVTKDYVASLDSKELLEYNALDEGEKTKRRLDWLKALDAQNKAADPGEVKIDPNAYRRFIESLPAKDRQAFRDLPAAEKLNTIKQFLADEKTEANGDTKDEVDEFTARRLKRLQEKLDQQAEKLAEANEKIKELLERDRERRKHKEAEEQFVPEVKESVAYPETVVVEFISTLPKSDYDVWASLPVEERDRMIEKWIQDGKPNIKNLLFEFFEENSINPKDFARLSPAEQQRALREWRNSIDFALLQFAKENRHEEAPLPSLKTYEVLTTKVEEIDPETGQHVIRDNRVMVDVVDHKMGTDLDLTHEEIAEIRKHRNRELGWKFRLASWFASTYYVVLNRVFDIEKVIAEENKKNQEMIRAIVDTGPDMNERWVFAKQGPDGLWRTLETGEIVDGKVVKHYRKLALKNPSRFQALCHYELSKQPEHKQVETWEQIFSLMAEEGYDRYHMYGIAIGLQFMNKPQYLAIKNTNFNYSPVFEMVDNGHGHEVPKLDPITGEKVPLRYTEDTIYTTGRFGRRVRVRDEHGKKVEVGDVVRDRHKVRFDTVDLELHEFDQEYHEKLPDGVTDKYELKHRMAYRYYEELDANGEKVVRKEPYDTGETYKVKKVLAVKVKGYAHEFAGKFASYQYGFRASDMAITLDFTRRAIYECTRLAKKYDNNVSNPSQWDREDFIAWQEYQVALSRMYETVSASRMGGSPGEEGKGPGADAATLRQEADIVARSQQENTPKLKRGQPVYPPRISGTAEAIRLWEDVAKYVDMAAKMYPKITQIRYSDYEAVQDEYKTRNEEAEAHAA